MANAAGYTRYPNYLLEALLAAPLTSAEQAVCQYIVRRTYGWQRQRLAPGEALADVMTVAEIAGATQRPARTIEGSLRRLVELRIVLQMSTRPGVRGVPNYYGVNPDVEAWGSGPDWVQFRVGLVETSQVVVTTRECVVVTTQNHVVPLRENAGCHHVKTRSATTRKHVVGDATNPTGSGAQGTPKEIYGKESIRQKPLSTDHIRHDPTIKAAGPAAGTPGESVSGAADGDGSGKPEEPDQVAIREAWEALELGGTPRCAGYGELRNLVKAKGLPFVRAWIEHLRANPQRLPDGAEPGRWFVDLFRGAMKRPWEWQRENGRRVGPQDVDAFGEARQ